MKMVSFMPNLFDLKASKADNTKDEADSKNIIWSIVKMIKNEKSVDDYEDYCIFLLIINIILVSNMRNVNNDVTKPVEISEIGTGTIASCLFSNEINVFYLKALNEREQKLKELQKSSEILSEKSMKLHQTAAKLASSNKGMKWLKFYVVLFNYINTENFSY